MRAKLWHRKAARACHMREGEVCNNVHLLTERKRQSANVTQHHCDVCLRHNMRNDAHVQTTVTNSVHAPPVYVAE